jgi:predicted transcriptional regulator
MKAVPLKLDDPIFLEVEQLTQALQTSRNRYINQALQYYNQLVKRQLLAKQLAEESLLCRQESMKVVAEFEPIDEWHE